MRYLSKKRISLLLSTVVLIAAIASGLSSAAIAASVPRLDSIRVALFIDTGKYKVTAPDITVFADSGIAAGIRMPEGTAALFESPANTTIRVGADQFYVMLLETDNPTTAQKLSQAILNSKLSDTARVFGQPKLGKPVYRVYAGPYPSKDVAAGARNNLLRTEGVAAAVKAEAAVVTGPYRLNAGVYGSEAEAVKQMDALRQKGLDANLAYSTGTGNKPAYAVWVGEEASAEGLATLKAGVQKLVPGLNVQPADITGAYVLKKIEVPASGEIAKGTAYYKFNPNGAKIILNAKQSAIQLTERSNRTYRGSLEVSLYNNTLAVINELPFEQYLYSVVSSELDAGWPAEALKAQAVAARTYALAQGMKYGIAHVSDSTSDQAYKGFGAEFQQAIAAVDATKGEVLVGNDGIITPFYYSNAGGLTAGAEEVWGQTIDYVTIVPSPDDGPQKGKLPWYRVVLPNGANGYVRSDLVRDSGERNEAGQMIMIAGEDGVNIRSAPYVDNVNNPAIAQVNMGDRLIAFEQTVESTAFEWIRGPYDADAVLKMINSQLNSPLQIGSLQKLDVDRGPSGRVTVMRANGQKIEVARPETYRTMLNSLPSTRFEIEETATISVAGADGAVRSLPENSGPIYTLSAGGTAKASTSSPVATASASDSKQQLTASNLYIMNGKNIVRLATTDPKFRFVGRGFGHGIGMSQWGAKGYAELGYDYKSILGYYYNGVTLVKDDGN